MHLEFTHHKLNILRKAGIRRLENDGSTRAISLSLSSPSDTQRRVTVLRPPDSGSRLFIDPLRYELEATLPHALVRLLLSKMHGDALVIFQAITVSIQCDTAWSRV